MSIQNAEWIFALHAWAGHVLTSRRRIGAEAASDLSILFHPIISLASVLWTGVLSNLLLPLWEATLKWHSSTAPAGEWRPALHV